MGSLVSLNVLWVILEPKVFAGWFPEFLVIFICSLNDPRMSASTSLFGDIFSHLRVICMRSNREYFLFGLCFCCHFWGVFWNLKVDVFITYMFSISLFFRPSFAIDYELLAVISQTINFLFNCNNVWVIPFLKNLSWHHSKFEWKSK